MKKPNFFIVGQPKAGTRSLYEMLKQHPEVFMPERKEPAYFVGNKESKKSIKSKKEYLSYFEDATNEKAVGEASTGYIYSKVAPEKIKEFNPNTKIIMILREPVSFLRSLYQHRKLYLNEERPIGEAVKSKEYLEKTKYCRAVKRYLDTFSKENLKIIVYDDYKENSEKVFKEICRFLDVDEMFKPKKEQGHPARILRFKPVLKLFKKLGIEGKHVKKVSPESFWNKIKGFLYKKGKIEIPEKTKKELKKKLKPEVEKVNDLLHKEGFLDKKRDLVKEWGY